MVTQELGVRIPPAALLTRCVSEPFLFLLDGGSTASWGTGTALLGFAPHATLRVAADGEAWVRADGHNHRWSGDPFDLLDRFRAEYSPLAKSGAPSCAGGVVAALSYDLRHWVESLPRHRHALPFPVLHAAAYDWLLAYSYIDGRYRLGSWRRSAAELDNIAAHILQLVTAPAAAHPYHRCGVRSNMDAAEYARTIRSAQAYIAAGDVYQVNLAQRFAASGGRQPAALFEHFQLRHPAPFAAYVDTGDCILVSNSPECFLAVQGDAVATFPIKGTRRRGDDARADAALVEDLRNDPKERAEHVMIVDLERNDLGRVCRIGSVRVEDFARICTLRSLHHMVSKVSGRLRPECTLGTVLRAMFPGGSITGAPKIRAMQIIDELEPIGRGFYTGAIGRIGVGGEVIFNLAIRTVVATPQQVTYHAGGGIVADSVPAREYEETLLKAQPFFAALQAAG